MKATQIQVTKCYQAKVSGNITTVRVDQIRTRRSDGRTVYDVTNLATGRKTTFESAAKFRSEVSAKESKNGSAKFVKGRDSQVGSEHRNPEAETTDVPPAVQRARGSSPVEASTPSDTARAGDDGSDALLPAIAGAVNPEAIPAKASHLGGLAARLQQRASVNHPHLIIEARAGTGKTTTLIEGLKYMKGLPVGITPSTQQQAIWDQLILSKDAVTVCFVAFNKSIATELQQRVPVGCEAMTMHSMGYKACQKQFGRLEPNNYVVQDYICEEMGMDIRDVRYKWPVVLKATEELVALCKQNLISFENEVTKKYGASAAYTLDAKDSAEQLDKLTSHYDVDLNGSRTQVYDLVPKVLERCKRPTGKISFDDMIWLPVVLNLPVVKYDLLLVDEAQDLNRCQQALAKKAGKRLILCGDPKQAIYGFAGADSESMKRMERELDGWNGVHPEEGNSHNCIVLPLNVTRRCGKAIVAEAQKIVPDFQAHESNPEGKISKATLKGVAQAVSNGDGLQTVTVGSYQDQVLDGDFVLCRVNAPLVQQCFRFIKAGRKANIQGRDVAAGLIKTVEKLAGKNQVIEVESFIAKLSDWLNEETRKENAKRFPNESKLITLNDRHDCLLCFTDGAKNTADVIAKINSVFTDDKTSEGIKLSSIHKSKGLESSRVFLLEPKGSTVPHPMAKTQWQKEQEWNLRYVAITRAINELIYVTEE